MYDTVVCSVELGVDESIFTEGQTITTPQGKTRVRLWRNPAAGSGQPRLTYYRDGRGGQPRLRVEFSIPKLLGLDPLGNVSEVQATSAVASVDSFLASCFGAAVPSVAGWQVSRIDYAYNFHVGEDLPLYLSLLQTLTLGRMERQRYETGVAWKHQRRWVKFYDKSEETGDGRVGVLRLEVSSFRPAVQDMCQRWFGCPPIVSELLRCGRALYVLAVVWERLGLGRGEVWSSDPSTLVHRLHRAYGKTAAGALYALTVIKAHGADSYKVFNLWSENTYYAWKRKLTEQGFLHESSQRVLELQALRLPVGEVLLSQSSEKASQAQNLGEPSGQPDTPTQKISPDVRARLEILPSAKLPEWLEVARAG